MIVSVRQLLFATLGAAVLLSVNAAMPPANVQAQPVVQALPNPAAAELGAALQRLSRDAQSLGALVDAANASLTLADIDAADGFLQRAQAIAPADGRVLAGLARLALARRSAPAALELFMRAERAGERMAPYAAERALAFDLVGRNAEAQRLYGEVLATSQDAETIRRLALSYAISGDQAASEATLLPLLQTRDLAAYRTRAFALAIGGKSEEAESITETILPARIASRLAPYLQYMVRLTRAQQAAAAAFGVFPPTSEIGRDAPEIAVYTGGEASPASPATPVTAANADARLIPGGAPLGPPVAQGAAAANAGPTGGELPPVQATAALPASQPPASTPALATILPTTESRAIVQQLPVQAGQFSSAPAAAPSPTQEAFVARPPSAQLETRTQPSTQPAPAPVDLRAAFADFALQSTLPRGPVSADAVDITRIAPPRDAPPVPSVSESIVSDTPVRQLPLNPSRHWVQVATGQDVAKFRYDWQRLMRASGGKLDGKSAYFAAWGANNRLVTGPFPTEGEAQQMVSELNASGVRSFPFTSTNGERVLPIP